MEIVWINLNGSTTWDCALRANRTTTARKIVVNFFILPPLFEFTAWRPGKTDNRGSRIVSLCAGTLPTELQGELNLARGCCRRSQQAGGSGRSSCGIEDVGVVGGYGHGEVRMVQDIKELRPKLRIKVLRNSLDVVVLENREI